MNQKIENNEIEKKEDVGFTELSNMIWGNADIIRDEMDGDTRDYMEITLPLTLLKRLLDIRQEYIINYIMKTGEYELNEDLLSAIDNEKENVVLYKVNSKQPSMYCITWDDIRNFRGNANAEEIEVQLIHFPDISIKTTARNKQEFMAEVVESFENDTIDKIFTTAQFVDRIKNTKKLKSTTFDKIIENFSKFNFNYDSAPSDIFSDMYMYLIAKFAEGAGKKGGEFFTPRPLCEGAIRLLEPKLKEKGQTVVADLTAGSATLLTVFVDLLQEDLIKHKKMSKDESTKELNSRLEIYLQEKTGTSLILGEMNLLLKGMDRFKAFRANTITEYYENDNGEKQIGQFRQTCDYIVGNPPYGLKDYGLDYFGPDASKKRFNDNAKEPRWDNGIPSKGEGEFAFLNSFIDMLNDNGKGVLILPLGTLFKDSTKFIRQNLIDINENNGDIVEGLVLLPDSMFTTTSIPVVLWVFNKNKSQKDKGKIFMINASEHYTKKGKFNEWNQKETLDTYINRTEIDGFSGYIELSEIAENDFNVSVQRYVFTEEPEEIIDIVKVMNDIQICENKLANDKNIMNGILNQIINLQNDKGENE